MEKFYNETLSKLGTAITEMEIETDNPLQRSEAIIYIITQCLSEVKEYMLETGFSNEDEEIRFGCLR